MSSVLGLTASRDSGMSTSPVRPWSFGATRITGLGTHGRLADVEVTAEGAASMTAAG
ncbi:hypothetical protein [Nocardioides sp.]|uniref:hypothetical protein n=1 Tax=Nocardioides sp. TaxID=35761 RepID=UPI00260DBCD8|nr:hypothetical protein [Nocardioides sp.]